MTTLNWKYFQIPRKFGYFILFSIALLRPVINALGFFAGHPYQHVFLKYCPNQHFFCDYLSNCKNIVIIIVVPGAATFIKLVPQFLSNITCKNTTFHKLFIYFFTSGIHVYDLQMDGENINSLFKYRNNCQA